MERQITGNQAVQVRMLDLMFMACRSAPSRQLALQAITHDLELVLAELRGADEPFGTAVVELVLREAYAEQRELERAAADAQQEEKRKQERADVLKAAENAAALEADGGASDMTVAEWLALVERTGGLAEDGR